MVITQSVETQLDIAIKNAPRLIHIPEFSDDRGTLCAIDWAETLPFTPERLYYIHRVTLGAKRAGHAHFQEEELMVCLAGKMRVVLDSGLERKEYILDRPDVGLYVPPMIWHELDKFSLGAVCAVLASGRHREEDYCHDYQQFLDHVAG